jgi:hypothetical protein
MISETEVKAKEDSELLEIWANQNDYVAEMVTLVKTEIKRRNLDTSGIHVPTVEEKKEAREASSNFTLARQVAFGTAWGGLLLVCAVLLSRLDPDVNLGGTVEITVLAVGVLLIVYAVGVWRGKRWAFASGVFVYTLITAFNILATIVNAVAFFRSDRPGRAAWTLIWGATFTFLSGGLALIFNALRKRRRNAGGT